MPKILIALLLVSTTAGAQFRRSATELAKENVQEYLTTKLFKNRSYQPVSFGELKARKEEDPDVAWCIQHTFTVTETKIQNDKKIPVQQLHQFMFYMDSKMRVLRSESFLE